MQLIEEVYHQVDQRTLSELHQSIYLAEVFRQILIAALLWLFLVRWHALYSAMQAIAIPFDCLYERFKTLS